MKLYTSCQSFSSMAWLVLHQMLSESSVGLLEIKCPYTHRLSTVEEATKTFCKDLQWLSHSET